MYKQMWNKWSLKMFQHLPGESIDSNIFQLRHRPCHHSFRFAPLVLPAADHKVFLEAAWPMSQSLSGRTIG